MLASESKKNDLSKRFLFLSHHWCIALTLCILAMLICSTCSWLRWPEPSVHDEFSYLLAADTFSSGRLTNPTHPHWQHFESFHIIHQPSYSSKYPPGQGLFLAVGQWLTGYPLVGLWILTGLGAMACYWMLLGWTSSRWAIVGTLLYCLHPCYQLSWAQSFWGGTLALAGGALVFGAVPRLLRKISAMDSVTMAIGAMTLAVTRPYEGFVFCLIIGVVVLIHWARQGLPSWRDIILRAVLPQATVYLFLGGLLVFHNHAVTGSFAMMPYQVHEKTYAMSPSFLWKAPLEKKDYRHAVMTDFHYVGNGKLPLPTYSHGLAYNEAEIISFLAPEFGSFLDVNSANILTFLKFLFQMDRGYSSNSCLASICIYSLELSSLCCRSSSCVVAIDRPRTSASYSHG